MCGCCRWCVRHLYKPLLSSGSSRITATLIVFFTSAFFHEYLISVPLRLFKVWGFLGMLVQAPLFPVTKFVEKKLGPRFGNVVVWISLILGQLCVQVTVVVVNAMPAKMAVKCFALSASMRAWSMDL